MRSFAGRRIVITGGSSGIGKELARQWLARCPRVDRGGRGREAGISGRELSASHPAVEAALCDVADLQPSSDGDAYIVDTGPQTFW